MGRCHDLVHHRALAGSAPDTNWNGHARQLAKAKGQVTRARIGGGQLIFRKELRQQAIFFRSKIRIRVRSISIPLNTEFLFGARSRGIDGRLDEVELRHQLVAGTIGKRRHDLSFEAGGKG